ncbi:MAG: enoyl-CoA hydratase/isomerase family protein [Chloroflexi bacterium]|nr:enoyl-CoA hydratase/isomerase family protein [Chloroflexota bacterium]
MTEPLLLERRGAVGWVTLHRPEQRNAVDRAMRAALTSGLAELDADPDIRVIVLTGAGPAFCAGADLKEGAARVAGHPLVDAPASIAAPLDALRTPVIAAVNGPAVGGGFEMVLACDIRIAAARARFALTELRIGSMPGSGGIQRLARAVPAAVAARMVLTGEAVDASEALRVGLVSDVVPDEELATRASAIAERVAAMAPLSLIAAKQSLRAAGELQLSAGLDLDRLLWAWLSQSADRAEGREAFREGRPPVFEGR